MRAFDLLVLVAVISEVAAMSALDVRLGELEHEVTESHNWITDPRRPKAEPTPQAEAPKPYNPDDTPPEDECDRKCQKEYPNPADRKGASYYGLCKEYCRAGQGLTPKKQCNYCAENAAAVTHCSNCHGYINFAADDSKRDFCCLDFRKCCD